MERLSFNVGVLLDLDCEPGRNQLTGIFRHANECRWHVHVFNSFDEAVDGVRNAPFDGFILGRMPDDAEAAALFAKTSFKLVTLGQFDNALGCRTRRAAAFTTVDEENVGRRGAEYLASLGNFTTFGIVNDKPLPTGVPSALRSWADKRIEGFSAVVAAKKQYVWVYRFDPDRSANEEKRRLAAWLRTLPMPAAVMGVCDETAVKVLAACRSAGIDVPNDLVLLGVDNDRVRCEGVRPQLSSLRIDNGHEGYWAAAALDRMMRGAGGVSDNRFVNVVDVVERESTRYLSSSLSVANAAMRYIEDHACSGIRSKDVVAYLNISRSIADVRFREIHGATISEAIENVRLDRVRKLLASTDWPVKRIAAACGYSSANRLTHVFGLRVGMTMREWRMKRR